MHFIYEQKTSRFCITSPLWREPPVTGRYPSQQDDVIKWKHFPRYWSFVRGIHRSPVNSPRTGQRRGALIFSLICAWTSICVNNRDAGDLIRRCAHYDVILMKGPALRKAFRCGDIIMALKKSGPHLNIKTVLAAYGDFHVKDKTAVRTSYL